MPDLNYAVADLALPMVDPDAELVQRFVLLSKALSDPIRVRMLSLMAQGRGCCGLPSPLPASDADDPEGICVCEFEERYQLGQSKVSYHLRVLKDAGLVTEQVRGKWTFYSLNKQAARDVVAHVQALLQL